MGLKAFGLRLLQSCNPNTYSDLTQEKISSTVKHFFIQFGILFVLLSLLFIPAYIIHADTFSERINAFTFAEFDGNFTTAEPLVLFKQPEILFDKNASAVGDSFLVFGADGVYYKSYIWFGESIVRYEVLKDVDSLGTTFFTIVAIFLLPAISFWAGVFILIKMLLLIRVFSLLGRVVPLFKYTFSSKQSLQIAFYAAVPSLLFEMLLFPFWRNTLLSLLIFVIFFVMGVFLVADRKVKK